MQLRSLGRIALLVTMVFAQFPPAHAVTGFTISGVVTVPDGYEAQMVLGYPNGSTIRQNTVGGAYNFAGLAAGTYTLVVDGVAGCNPIPTETIALGPNAVRNYTLTCYGEGAYYHIRTGCIDTSPDGSTTSIQRVYGGDRNGRPLVGKTVTFSNIPDGRIPLSIAPMSAVTNTEGFATFTFTAGPGVGYEHRRIPVSYSGTPGILPIELNITLGIPDVHCERAPWDPVVPETFSIAGTVAAPSGVEVLVALAQPGKPQVNQKTVGGAYTFSGLAAGSYTVAPYAPNGCSTMTPASVTVGPNATANFSTTCMEKDTWLDIQRSCMNTDATKETKSIQRFTLRDRMHRPLGGKTITLGAIAPGLVPLSASPTTGVTNADGYLDVTFTAGPVRAYERRLFPILYDGYEGMGSITLNIALGEPELGCMAAPWDIVVEEEEDEDNDPPPPPPATGGSITITSPKRGEDHETNASSVELGGTFSGSVASVTVNGLPAQLNGESRKWHARVPLAKGGNTLIARGLAADGTELASDTVVIERVKDEKQTEDPVKPKKFEDVPPTSGAAPAVEKLAKRGIIKGRADGKFEPDGFVTRAEFAKMLAGAMGVKEADGGSGFSDVPNTHTLAGYIAAIARKGWIKGQDGKFHPSHHVTRMEAARMILRAKALQAKATTQFTDVTSSEEQGIVGAIVDAKIAKGNGGRFEPGRRLTRAEAAIMLAALL